MTATSLTVDHDDLVDDLKMKILAKYPNSLLRTCDPADLTVSIPGDIVKAVRLNPQATTAPLSSPSLATTRKLSGSSTTRPRGSSLSQQKSSYFKSPLASPHGANPIELQPDELVFPILDKYFPEGMSMGEAFDVRSPSDRVNAVAMQAAASAASQTVSLPSNLAPPVSLSRTTSSSSVARPKPTAGSAGAGQATPTVTTSAPMPAKPKVVQPPSSSLLVRRASTAPVEKRSEPGAGHNSGNNGVGSGAGAGVLLLPRQLKLASSRSDSVVSIPPGVQTTTAKSSLSSLSTDNDTTPPATGTPGPPGTTEHNQEGLLELRKLYNKLPNSQPSVVVPQVNVLIVEDNEINQKILETALRRNKVRCSIAKNGRDAVAKWREGGFHIILMDLQLPVMSGLEASKEIRRLETVNRIGAFSHTDSKAPVNIKEEDLIDQKEFNSPVIIVALTASSSAEDRSEALRAGCNDFLTKPVNLEWLQQKLLEWGCMQALIDFEGWKTWHTPPEIGQAKLGNSLFRKNGGLVGMAGMAAISASIQRPQSPRISSTGRSGRGLESFSSRSRSSSSRRTTLSPSTPF